MKGASFAVLGMLVLLLAPSPRAAANGSVVYRDPVFSPDGKAVAFVGATVPPSIMLIDADGKHLRTLVYNVDASGLKWSPDGSSLVYAVNNSDIWRVDVATSVTTQLTNDGQYTDWQPSWSPDGTMIAYDKFERCFRCTGIWVMNADGSNQREVTADDGRRPSFSPTSDSELAISSDQVLVIDLSGATVVPNAGLVGGAYTTWSPRGTYVAYELSGLWIEDLTTMTPRRISKLVDGGSVSWSPDGRVLAAGYHLKVALVRAKDGSHFKVLANSAIYGGTSWFKETIAYVHSGYCGLDLAREDGTRVRRLTGSC